MMKKRITLPIIVEGKYDKITLGSLFDATVFTTDGFSVFNSKEKRALLSRIAEGGVILLTDSDGGGRQIRSYLNSILPREKVHNLYIPRVEGKERRKSSPSRSGTLGVEGMTREVLTRVLAPFIDDGGRVEKTGDENPECEKRMITKVDFYLAGLSGGENSSRLRARLAESYGLPPDMTANALLEALNLISDFDEYKKRVEELFSS